MFNETFTYEDYNGETRTETCYFHFSTSEAIRLESSVEGGLSKKLEEIVKAKDTVKMVKFFEDLILGSYGIKTDDGRQFKKSEEIKTAFMQSPMYDMLLEKLLSEEGYAEAFISGIAPKQNKK